MKVYHGSNIEIHNPDIYHSRKKVDFGAGFYVTLLKEQAENYCKKFIRRGQKAFVSEYILDDDVFDTRKSLVFEEYSEMWLDFVFTCRRKSDTSNYEIVMGGIANDKVFNTIELYFDGLIDKEETLGRLTYMKPNNQICIRVQDTIDKCLHFVRSYVYDGK